MVETIDNIIRRRQHRSQACRIFEPNKSATLQEAKSKKELNFSTCSSAGATQGSPPLELLPAQNSPSHPTSPHAPHPPQPTSAQPSQAKPKANLYLTKD